MLDGHEGGYFTHSGNPLCPLSSAAFRPAAVKCMGVGVINDYLMNW